VHKIRVHTNGKQRLRKGDHMTYAILKRCFQVGFKNGNKGIKLSLQAKKIP